MNQRHSVVAGEPAEYTGQSNLDCGGGLPRAWLPHSCRPITPRALSLRPSYPTVLTVVHSDGTSSYSLHTKRSKPIESGNTRTCGMMTSALNSQSTFGNFDRIPRDLGP